MSDMSADFFAAAEAVPVWTKPGTPAFVSRAVGAPGRFNSWAPAPAVAPQPAPAMAAAAAHQPEAGPDMEQMQAEIYAAGFNEGHAAALAAMETQHQAIDRLAHALENVRTEAPVDLARMLTETVSRLVRQVMGEVEIDGAKLAERALAIAAMVTEEGAPARLRLHPSDLVRIDGLRPDLQLIADPSLAEGTIVAETASGWIEDGPAIRMEKLRTLLDQLGARR